MYSRIKFGLSVSFKTLISCLFLSGLALAQTSTVRGTAADQQGRPIAGATITLTDPAKNFVRTQVTNQDGAYVFSAIPPGTYRVDGEAKGFKKVTVNDVRAMIDTPTALNLNFEVGSVSDVITVSGATEAPINVTDATLGNAFENRRIIELPLNARNIVGLLSLQRE